MSRPTLSQLRLIDRVSEKYWEWHFGVDTCGQVPAQQLACRDALQYCPVPFRAFFEMMRHIPPDLLQGTFVDYGAGRGRALVLAASRYPFKRVLGVEISPELCRAALKNLNRIGARHAEVICADAATYDPPATTSVFFFFNPFLGATMEAVVQNLLRSVRNNPRRFAIAVCNPKNIREALIEQDWLRETSTGEISSDIRWTIFAPGSS